MENEKRLIDANALKDEFRRYMADRFDRERCVSEENCITCGRVCLFQRTINNAPTVDAVEVVHGKWEEIGVADYKCSRCGFRFTSADPISMFQYCRCGAKMDGGNEE